MRACGSVQGEVVISAFGIVHKSFTKMEPKLLRARKAIGAHNKTKTMEERTRSNYVIYRNRAGSMGRAGFSREIGQKVGADQSARAKAMLKASGSINRRKPRVLP